jgi:Coenzyme PQQ synthesis protein D (PqqD)
MNEKAPNAKPIARKQGLVIQDLPDEVLVYDRDRDHAHCLNQTAAFVWQRCDGKNTTAQIAQSLGHQFNCTVDEKIVWLALDQLGKNHLLDRQAALPPTLMGMNRRSVMRALGLAAVVAVPLVTSIVAPTPAQAATCKPTGASCAVPAECCSGLCSDTCQP